MSPRRVTERELLRLEHATIRPLGEFPDHCEFCRETARARELQATCPHPPQLRESIDVTYLGAPRQITMDHCRRCGMRLN